MGNKAVLACFMGVIALITYRDFKKPDSSWPLGPVPPPYRYTYSAVVFGIIAMVSDIWSEKIATVVASGVLIGVMYSVVSGQSASAGLKSLAPTSSSTADQSSSNGTTGSTAIGGGAVQV